jgi:hypothetical protein
MNYLFTQDSNAGFFSDFNVTLGCLNYIIKNDIKQFSFIWNNSLYQDDKTNLFDKYFFKNKIYDTYDAVMQTREIGGTYYQPVTPHETLLNSHNILQRFNYFEENDMFNALKHKCMKAENTLGIHVRGTDHWQHGPLFDIDTYFNAVDKKLDERNFTNIFLATDEEQNIEKFTRRYGNKLIVNKDIIRSTSSVAIHHINYKHKEKLIHDVMLDALSLSQCEEILITSSNVAGYAIAVNPFLKYNYIGK